MPNIFYIIVDLLVLLYLAKVIYTILGKKKLGAIVLKVPEAGVVMKAVIGLAWIVFLVVNLIQPETNMYVKATYIWVLVVGVFVLTYEAMAKIEFRESGIATSFHNIGLDEMESYVWDLNMKFIINRNKGLQRKIKVYVNPKYKDVINGYFEKHFVTK